jgi:hypothetical protein
MPSLGCIADDFTGGQCFWASKPSAIAASKEFCVGSDQLLLIPLGILADADRVARLDRYHLQLDGRLKTGLTND